MKGSKTCLIDNMTAAANLVKSRFLGFDGNYCGANAKALGVTMADTDSGQQVPYACVGIPIVECGAATINIGDHVASDSTGKAVKAADLALVYGAGTYNMTANSATPAITFSGGVLPQKINGQSLDYSAPNGFIRVRL